MTMAPIRSMTSLPVCLPRFATERTPGRRTLGGEVDAIARELGQPLLPWQRLVADVGLELLDDGTPAFREVIVTVPRQSGKTFALLCFECHRGVKWGSPQRIAYSAQTGWDARRKLIDDQAPMLLGSPLRVVVDRVLRGSGNESITFKGGSRIDVLASSEAAGHGRTIDLAVLDEVFSDTDDRREQSMLPAMATRKDAQLLITSTAGTDESVYLKRKVDAGRAAVLDGATAGIAYFEWAAEDDDDPDDQDVWHRVMPALGHTIAVKTIEHARQSMTEGEFRRAYLNQWTSSDERVIPQVVWAAVQDKNATVDAGRVFGVEIAMSRGSAVIAAADASGVVELVDQRPGVGWLFDRCLELFERWGSRFVFDSAGPAGATGEDLVRAGVPVELYSTAQMKYATSRFVDLVADRKLRVRSENVLDAAVAGAVRRPVGDSWLWGRKANVEVSPLVAVTLAVDAALVPEDTSPPVISFV